ncbi:7657_t:CDS:2 [Rhizophagus irregularis]|nr:7657_t:CDS:2 [Rhizophagus irregularis]
MLDDNNMIDIHLYFNNDEPMDTWSNGNICTRIDYIFVNNELLNRIEEHEVLNIEERLMTDHKALTITIKIDNETTTTNNKGNNDMGIFKSKLSVKDWELIAEKVEDNIEKHMNIDENENNNKEDIRDIDKKWVTLKNIIVNEITNTRKEVKDKQMIGEKKYETDIKNMSECELIEKNSFNANMRRDLDFMIKFSGKERKVITNYKKLVYRFTDIVNARVTLSVKDGQKLYDSLDDTKKLDQVKSYLEKEKNRLHSDL